MTGLLPDEMKSVKEMAEGDWRILVWSELLAARKHRRLVLTVISTLGAPVAIVVVTRFALWALAGAFSVPVVP